MLMVGYGQSSAAHAFHAYDRDGDATVVAADEAEVIGGTLDESKYTATMPAGTIRYELRHIDEPEYTVWVADVGIASPVPTYDESPQLTLCALVADILDGQTFGGVLVSAKSDNLLPIYDYDDLPADGLTVDVIPSAEPMIMEQQTHGTATEACPVVVAVQGRCDVSLSDSDYRKMLQATREISIYLQSTNLTQAGFHGPLENSFEDRPETVDGAARYEGYVTLAYRHVDRTL